jgi:hypothetical protein
MQRIFARTEHAAVSTTSNGTPAIRPAAQSHHAWYRDRRDDGAPLSSDAVEQRRLADVWTADEDDRTEVS